MAGSKISFSRRNSSLALFRSIAQFRGPFALNISPNEQRSNFCST
jgi:hypothetical protein